MTDEQFRRLVDTTKAALCMVIDTETEASGRLASYIVAAIATEFLLLPEPAFATDLNATLAAASLPWRMVPVQ
jgi:hypothetical protein